MLVSLVLCSLLAAEPAAATSAALPAIEMPRVVDDRLELELILREPAPELSTTGSIGSLKSLKKTEAEMGAKLGDPANPLLVSCRSGARDSMPGMMDTVLNIGLNEKTLAGLIAKTGNERFGWDTYRRFVQMYGDVVLGLKPTDKKEIDPFEKIMEELKHEKGVHLDNELTVNGAPFVSICDNTSSTSNTDSRL